jgi:hypothetical protein
MDKNVKKIISEAFNELYNEIINEESIRREDIPTIIDRAKRTGRGIEYNFDSSVLNDDSARNFNTIMDALIDAYLAIEGETPEKAKIREAIQGAFNPSLPKMVSTVGKGFYKFGEDLKDAMSDAYREVLLQDFDKIINAYNKGTGTFSGLVTSDIKRKVISNLRGSGQDVFGNKDGGPRSMEDPIGDDLTLGDTLSNRGDDFARDNREYKKLKDALETTIDMVYGQLTETGADGEPQFKNPLAEKRFKAFEGLIMGDTTQQVLDDNPGIFKDVSDVNREFGRTVEAAVKAGINDYISNAYGINFDLESIDPKLLKQTFSQSGEWAVGKRKGKEVGKVTKIKTPEMVAAWKNVQQVMSKLGLKDKDFNSAVKQRDILQKLKGEGNEELAREITSALLKFQDASKAAKEQGKFDVKRTLLPSKPEEETDEYGTFFEGVDYEELMRRVINRLNK